jgi:multidrug efflux pump subunit AcrB
VLIVVFLFLQSWRATLIPMLRCRCRWWRPSRPSSPRFSINTLSLFGMVLAIGIVVDDAIVVVEAVERTCSAGLSPREATRKAMDECRVRWLRSRWCSRRCSSRWPSSPA